MAAPGSRPREWRHWQCCSVALWTMSYVLFCLRIHYFEVSSVVEGSLTEEFSFSDCICSVTVFDKAGVCVSLRWLTLYIQQSLCQAGSTPPCFGVCPGQGSSSATSLTAKEVCSPTIRAAVQKCQQDLCYDGDKDWQLLFLVHTTASLQSVRPLCPEQTVECEPRLGTPSKASLSVQYSIHMRVALPCLHGDASTESTLQSVPSSTHSGPGDPTRPS